jgi:hypothetical protein
MRTSKETLLEELHAVQTKIGKAPCASLRTETTAFKGQWGHD